MNIQSYNPSWRIILIAAGYLLIALAAIVLEGSFPMIVGTLIAYSVLAFLLSKAAKPAVSRTPKPLGHPVQDGKDAVLHRRHRLAYDQLQSETPSPRNRNEHVYEASSPFLTFFDQVREQPGKTLSSARGLMLGPILYRLLSAGLAVLLAILVVPPLVGI